MASLAKKLEEGAAQGAAFPKDRLIQISRSLGDRLREAKSELAREIAEAKASPGHEEKLEEEAEHAGPAEMFIEVETEEEKMRSKCWGLELLYRTGAIDPATQIYAAWLAVVSLAFCYNLWSITFRESFTIYTQGTSIIYWLCCDYVCDAIYLIDIIFIKTHILYHNEDGLMVCDWSSTRRRYVGTREFKLDVLALMPLDFLYLVPQIGVRPLLRIFRLLKMRAFWEFFDRITRLIDSPEVVRIFKILVYILVTVHIYTCAYYAFSVYTGIGTTQFVFEGQDEYPYVYARCYYIAFKIATSINSDKELISTQERAFMIVAWLVATFVVVVLLAQIREAFFEFTQEEDEFSRTVHTALSYMKRYNCPSELEGKVRSWFMYTRSTQRVLEIQKILSFLPRHIQAALALEINYKTLSKVTLFANCDRTMLTDLVVKLKPVLYLPGDYICKKGEIGKEMYIIVKGQAEVVSAEGKIFVTLSAGAVFGEISLLAVGGANRRTANVRSKGFSNLFTLSKDDFEEIMKHYPLIHARLKRRVAETLAKSKQPQAPSPPKQEAPKPAVREATSGEQTAHDETPAHRPRTPKILQILRALVPNMPSLRRLFRVEPAMEPISDGFSTTESIDAELAGLHWSTPSPDSFYVRTEVEQKFWDAPETVTASRASAISDMLTADTGTSSSSSNGTSTSDSSKATTNKPTAKKPVHQPQPSSKYYFPSSAKAGQPGPSVHRRRQKKEKARKSYSSAH